MMEFYKQFVTLIVVVSLTIVCNGKHLNKTESVVLKDCSIEHLKLIGQENVAQPSEIIASFCHLDGIPNAIFLRFSKLKVLEITDSQLKTMEDFALNGLNGLQVLNLSRNNLTQVKMWSDQNLESLLSLDLRRNSINELHKFAFKRYPNLMKLNLAVNHIETIPDDIFKCTPLLKYLNLGKNHLISIDVHTFKYLHKLTALELKHNEIEFIHSDTFVGNTHLKSLHLQANLINTFEQELISNLPRLMHLNLSHNLLEELSDETFEKNMELKSLDISYNKLEKISEYTFKGLEVLEVFNASHNTIKQIDKAMFVDFTNLKHLDFANNFITSLPNKIFEAMQLLEFISFSNNSLKQIETNVFQELKKLSVLDLSINNLMLDNFMWPVIDLKYLNLTYNAYKHINVSVLENLVADLYGNPFDCEFLIEEINSSTSQNIHFGKDYKIKSKGDFLKLPGIQCYEANTGAQHKIIVLEINRINVQEESQFERLQTKPINISDIKEDNYDYRSALLWLSFGCVVVLFSLRTLKCMLKKSEKHSEEYHQAQQQNSFDDLSKSEEKL